MVLWSLWLIIKTEANSIVSFSKYPPNGIRGAGFGFVHDNYISTEPIDVMKQSNENLINIIQIETKEGLIILMKLQN